jgi:hypothetical protein
MRDELRGKLRKDLRSAGKGAETSSDHDTSRIPGFTIFGGNPESGAVPRDVLNLAIFQGRKGLLAKPQSVLNKGVQWDRDGYFGLLRGIKLVNAKNSSGI